eukprot:TRINITY_DN12154_c0_g1::TRINITY_DN12154_c0_g1_i1::g.26505::m.26505 TRINITY_DN12154_c0_g1::TRINITY_DN12154_c0_g1_i1::g.26505  ORF type:complete len:585 (-),score=107.23,sp/Q3V3N7/BBS1_MOUSE/40.00/1e-141,BBS1/PF14779.1/2.4e-77,BBS2_Mid/PF14783.1/4,BBS2_Mid/PF14783.1/91,BBS2_Mid/PF14783.1/2.8e+02,BBS2_Mid/PF14783.1/3.9,PHTB1_N/PF14727.1/1.2e+03,PHTB1_N/PF14727.1/1.6e+02,PHTB1_N/PF14727.1/3.2 TRINITY_DN12154_c0_g1_i1:527-2281(-)
MAANQAPAPTKPEPEKPVFLDAWYDPVAGLKTFSQCVRVADINGDNDYRLMIADLERKLRIYKGKYLTQEHALLDIPCALCSWYCDTSQPREPLVAVAAGPHIFIYRNLNPYYKFTLPPMDVEQIEREVWEDLKQGRLDHFQAKDKLEEARDQGLKLTTKTIDFLAIEAPEARAAFVDEQKHTAPVHNTVITCMDTLRKAEEDDSGVSSLVIGTESGHIMILEPNGQSVKKTIAVKGTPAFLAISGLQDVEYRICVATRDGKVYSIKNGEVTGNVIELESQPCGLLRSGKCIIVACMGNVVHSFHLKGKKNYSLYLPAPVTNIELISSKISRSIKALAVALANREIRIYNEKHLVTTLMAPDVVTAMRFGRYGREDHTLITVYKNGALSIKMLPRTTNLEVTGTNTGPPPEQDIPLNVPKKTKLYVEQTQREREEGIEMHRVFQRDLCKLRLATARAYVKVITDGRGPTSYTAGSSLRLNAQVQGLGPKFKIKVGVQNCGEKPIYGVMVNMSFNDQLYQVEPTLVRLPALIPGLQHRHEVNVQSLDSQTGGGGVIKVFVTTPASCVPVICAVVNMPWSEPSDLV